MLQSHIINIVYEMAKCEMVLKLVSTIKYVLRSYAVPLEIIPTVNNVR